MKKIKKAAVLVPAFATVVLATVGSVTGTMAWFTANRIATSTASVFEATAMTTKLVVTAAPGTGTKKLTGQEKEEDNTKTSDVVVDGKLTHGSFDMNSKELSVAKYGSTSSIDSHGNIVDKEAFTNISTLGKYDNTARTKNWKAGTDSSGSIWYAVTWTYSMEYTFGGSTHDHALFIDLASSVFADSVSTGVTKNGFRLGIFDTKNNIGRIYGGDDTSASKDAPKAGSTYTGGYYVSNDGGKGDTNTKIYSDGTYLTNLGLYATAYDSSKSTQPLYAKMTDSDVQEAADFQLIGDYNQRTDYLGLFPASRVSKDIVTLNFDVVAWFEGTDSSIINANLTSASSKITAALKFYVNEVQPAQD